MDPGAPLTAAEREALRVALEAWRICPEDGRAGEVVVVAMEGIAATLSSFPTLVREDAVQIAVTELWALIHGRTLVEPVEYPATWLRTRIRWRALDLVRLRKPPTPPKRLKKPRRPERECPFDEVQRVALLERVFKVAMAMRDAHQREHLDAAWELARRWHCGPDTMQVINAAEMAAAGITDPKEISRAYDRTTRAQARLREALGEAVARLERRTMDGLDEDDAALAREYIQGMNRCPKVGPAASMRAT